MPNKYRPINFDSKRFKGQFVLTAEAKDTPPDWSMHTFNQWRLFTLALPVLPVYNETQQWLGWCIGHPVIDRQIDPEKVILHTTQQELDMAAIDDFYQRVVGKWALLLVQPGWEHVFLDPYGSLATVFGTREKAVASTPTLIGNNEDWDDELIDAIGLPEKDLWLPAGITAKKNVRRLLPNHSLDLKNWTVKRHWPTPETNFSVDPDTASAVERIVNHVKGTLKAIVKAYPLCLTITAGRDSRSVLACAHEYWPQTSFFTFEAQTDTPDMQIPALLVNHFKLNHQFFQIQEANSDELKHWLAVTGMSVSGRIWKIHKTLEKVDPNRVLLPGLSAEVHKGGYWRSADRAGTKLTAQEVLTRGKLPHHPALIKAMEAWLAELQFLDTFRVLDLFHIEQRLGCWAAPQHYGNTTSVFEVSIFNSRYIYQIMMRLPHNYRRKKQLASDICQYTEPELLLFPFNEFTGLKGYFSSNKKRLKKVIKELIGR